MVYEYIRSPGGQPFFSLLHVLLVESKVNHLFVFLILILKLNLMCIDVVKVIFCLLGCGGTQTFVVLYLPAFKISTFSPLLILRDSEETDNIVFIVLLRDFDNRSNELLQESVVVNERRPKVMDEVNNETLNVGTVMILICHYHHRSVSQLI